MNRRHVPNRPPSRRRHLRPVPDPPPVEHAAEQQGLFQQLRAALRQDDPLSLMMLVSGMVEACDPSGKLSIAGATVDLRAPTC
ncbi:MAG: hypothetical protein QM582_15445 [Micropruina sp.]|uniref:hypothetical protein n=1 Tax=Micropruina sp. TaxID=2737536 RepID=UPI0039E2D444